MADGDGLPIDVTSGIDSAMGGAALDPEMMRQVMEAAQAKGTPPRPSAIQGSIDQGQVTPGGAVPQPTQTAPQQPPQQGPPQMGGKPLLLDYIQSMIKGGQQGPQGQPGPSRGDMTLRFMGQFLSNMAAGLAAGGHGPGANERGAAAAIQAPYQRNVAQYQMGQQQQVQQAQVESEKAKTELAQAQAEQAKNVVMTPYGPMNQKLAEKVFPAAIRKEGMENVADTKAGADPVKNALKEASDLLAKGDTAGFKAKLQEASQLKGAVTAPGKDNEISLIQKANAGDKDALAAWNKLQAGRVAVRGATANMRPMTYYDPELQRNITMAAGEAEAQQKAGKVLLPSGPVPATTLLQMQRAQNAIPNAVDDVSKNLKAWDNAGDRAIFARVIRDTPEGADPATWMGSVINQVAKENLSPEGKGAIVSLQRLNESLGTLRAISGLPATAGSMMATRALMPGATTPDSKMAKAQLDQIKKLVEQETGVPFLGGKSTLPQPPSKGGAKPTPKKGDPLGIL